VFHGGDWVSRDAEEVVYDVFDKHRNVIDETCDQARDDEGRFASDVLGQRVMKWEQESNRPDFEDRCQEKVSRLGYENKTKVTRKLRKSAKRY